MPWLDAFLQKISNIRPKFLALHLQEVGGKTYEKSMEYVQEFIKHLCEAPETQDFELIRVYMDEDFKSAEHFTVIVFINISILMYLHTYVCTLGLLLFLTKFLYRTTLWPMLY